MESNWRYNVEASGMCWFEVGGGGYINRTFRYLAKLNTPLPPPFSGYDAVALAVRPTSTQIVGVSLFIGDYPVPGDGIDIPFNTPFPGGLDVVPDSPAIDWD